MYLTGSNYMFMKWRKVLFLDNFIWQELTLPVFWLDALVLLKANEAKSWGTSIYSYVEACFVALLLIALCAQWSLWCMRPWALLRRVSSDMYKFHRKHFDDDVQAISFTMQLGGYSTCRLHLQASCMWRSSNQVCRSHRCEVRALWCHQYDCFHYD